MNIACGTDIIEIYRVKEFIESEHGDAFIKRVYTAKEIEYCESRKNQKFQHYAARFAAKEAILKAISKKLDNKYNIEWKQLEIRNLESGRPYAIINHPISEEIQEIDISLSHCREYATANALVVFNID